MLLGHLPTALHEAVILLEQNGSADQQPSQGSGGFLVVKPHVHVIRMTAQATCDHMRQRLLPAQSTIAF
jgi:hypothetical protein